ncbi:MAG TPA: hypothetical protein VJ725_27135 [Thermoanaerobaculia bacterium]|nr:hypothetical protein [Thermoanaerobaculia bacterium]
MTRSAVLRLSLAALFAASAAHAGTGYVPLPGIQTVGSATYEAQVLISNNATQTREVKQVQLATDTDGTPRGAAPAGLQIAANQTNVVKPAATFRGLLELSGSTDLRFAARLVRTGQDSLGVQIPVVTSDNMQAANLSLTLQGLIAAGTRTTDITIVNVGKQAAQCRVSLYRADGTTVLANSEVNLKPLSHRYFVNVFSGLAAEATEARATVTCNRDFFAYALLSNSATGELAVVEPSGSGESLLTVPGAEPACPVGATCFDAKGLVHQPTKAEPVKRITFNAPAGTFTRLRLSLEVTVGNFYPQDPDGKHLIYWFVINKNFDMPGMLYFRGPNAYTALARHGVGLTHPEKKKIVQPFQGVPGRTYKVENDYDMGRGVLTIRVTDVETGEVKVNMTDAPNVAKVTLTTADKFLVDMGFPEGKVPDEVPSYGWAYRNVHLEVIK